MEASNVKAAEVDVPKDGHVVPKSNKSLSQISVEEQTGFELIGTGMVSRLNGRRGQVDHIPLSQTQESKCSSSKDRLLGPLDME
jgi:transcriptional regulator of nitric oxide reductase